MSYLSNLSSNLYCIICSAIFCLVSKMFYIFGHRYLWPISAKNSLHWILFVLPLLCLITSISSFTGLVYFLGKEMKKMIKKLMRYFWHAELLRFSRISSDGFASYGSVPPDRPNAPGACVQAGWLHHSLLRCGFDDQSLFEVQNCSFLLLHWLARHRILAGMDLYKKASGEREVEHVVIRRDECWLTRKVFCCAPSVSCSRCPFQCSSSSTHLEVLCALQQTVRCWLLYQKKHRGVYRKSLL